MTSDHIFEESYEEILWWQLYWRTTEQLVWREQWQRIWRLLVSSVCAHYYQKLSYKPSKKSAMESSKGSKWSYCSEYYNLISYAIFECAKYNQYNINFGNTINFALDQTMLNFLAWLLSFPRYLIHSSDILVKSLPCCFFCPL